MDRETTLVTAVADIIRSYNTDKCRIHSYGPIYNEWLTPIRDRVTAVLELGVLNGESLKAWREVFPEAYIHGVDIDRQAANFEHFRISTHYGNATDSKFLNQLAYFFGPWDFICDDASHRPQDQITSLLYLWQYLRPGGVYAIEDVFPQNLHMFQCLPCVIYEGNQMVVADNIVMLKKDE